MMKLDGCQENIALNTEKKCRKKRGNIVKNRKKIKLNASLWRRTNSGIVSGLLSESKKRSKKKSLDFDLDAKFVKSLVEMYPRCPVVQEPFAIDSGQRSSRTLDRLNPKKGYTKGNVVLVSGLANTIKSNAIIEEINILATNLENIISLGHIPWTSKFKKMNFEEKIFEGWFLHKNNSRSRIQTKTISSLLKHSRARAKKKNDTHSIIKKDIIFSKVCPLLKIKLCPGTRIMHDNSPTLDRIDNALGYTPENIQIISLKANRMKSNATINILWKVYKGYARLNNHSNTKQTIEELKKLGL